MNAGAGNLARSRVTQNQESTTLRTSYEHEGFNTIGRAAR
jgi:hypothetical protein